MRTLSALSLLSLHGWKVEGRYKVHGVNYGGRFVPEYYLALPGTEYILFRDIQKNDGALELSLCDVNTDDKQERMSQFLDMNIREEHFFMMASLGFNVVRLPLGYWNLIDLEAGTTPVGPWRSRWLNLQQLQPSAKSYMKWIDQIFQYAQAAGLQVLLDFHAAPGGQTGNQDCGCDLGTKPIGVDMRKIYTPGFFDNDWNRKLSVRAVEAMANICASKGSVCWGIEFLNEPYGPLPKSVAALPNIGPISAAAPLEAIVGKTAMLSRDSLRDFYLEAISASRKHIAEDVPIVLMDWTYWLKTYWSPQAKNLFSDKGKILFSTHFYPLRFDQTLDLESAKADISAEQSLNDAFNFAKSSGFELLVTEYALSGHGSGEASDRFPYANLTRWLVDNMDRLAGEMVWNFDAKYNTWGPVESADDLGVPWREIYGVRGTPWYYGVFMNMCISACFVFVVCFGLAWVQRKNSVNLDAREADIPGRQPSQAREEQTAFLAADGTNERGPSEGTNEQGP